MSLLGSQVCEDPFFKSRAGFGGGVLGNNYVQLVPEIVVLVKPIWISPVMLFVCHWLLYFFSIRPVSFSSGSVARGRRAIELQLR